MRFRSVRGSIEGGDRISGRRDLKVTLEIGTTLFLDGAKTRGAPELRAVSFRGVLRFWLRALLDGVLGDDPQKIFECESKVFGSTGHVSPVVVRIEHSGKLDSDNFDPLLHRSERKSFNFKGFKPGQKFTLTLLSRNENPLSQAANALRLLCLLGGLGRRNRRGYGSLQIVERDLPSLKAENHYELCSQLERQLEEILSSNASVISVPSFPMLHASWGQVKVCKTEFNDWEEAINSVMQEASKHKNPALGWAGKEGRQASPVHVHIVKLTNSRYALVLINLLSELNQNLKSHADRNKLVDFLNAFEGEVVFGFKEVPENWPIGSEK